MSGLRGWGFFFLLAGSAWSLSCDHKTSAQLPESRSASVPLWGSGATVDVTSLARNRTSIAEQIGTIAMVKRLHSDGSVSACSGVLVDPGIVVTAAHCLFDWDGSELRASRVRVAFPQGGSDFLVHAIDAPPGLSVSSAQVDVSTDLVLLFLVEDVPSDVVGVPARLYLSRDMSGVGSPYYFGGVGNGVPDCQGPCMATRRWGEVVQRILFRRQYIEIGDDPNSTNITFGDSGGVLFATEHSSGELVVVGINSRISPTAQFLTSIGWHDAWLASADTDGDGVPYGIDNCPAWYNPLQEDADGDGFGDRCDNCSPGGGCSDSPGSLFFCNNPSQADADSDGIGDACDHCDGIECSSCSGVVPPPASCLTDADCAASHGFCVVEQGTDLQSRGFRCSGPDDLDGDLVADQCDLCPWLSSRDTRNSNAHAEAIHVIDAPIEDYRYLQDACDPVPQFRLKPQPIPSVIWAAQQGYGLDGPRNIVEIEGETWVGLDMVGLGVAGPVPDATLSTKFQFCSCYDALGVLRDDEACVRGVSRQCDVGGIRSSVRTEFGWIDVDQNGVAVRDFVAGYGVGRPARRSFRWRWLESVVRHHVEAVPVIDDPLLAYKVGGVLASVVERGSGTTYLSGRDALADSRVVLQHYEVPRFSNAAVGVAGRFRDCALPGCLRWLVFGPDEILEPGDIRSLVLQPAILDGLDGRIQFLGRDPAYTADEKLDDDAAESLLDAGDVWLPRSEAATRFVTVDRKEVMGIVVGRGVKLGDAPRKLHFSDGVLKVEGRMEPADQRPLLDFALDDGEVAAYSARWDALFFAGGPTMGHRLRRYDLSSGTWSLVVPEQLTVGGKVLGLALDSPAALVYLLHVPEGATEASLVRVSLKTLAVDVIGTFSHRGEAKLISIRTTESGALVLARVDESGFDVWRFVTAPELEQVGHSRVEDSMLLDLPVVTGEVLHAPVRPVSGEDVILDIALDALEDDGQVVTEL